MGIEVYGCRIAGRLAVISVDLSLRPVAPDPRRPVLLYVSLDLRAPDEEGLVQPAEAEILAELQAALDTVLVEALGARWVGTITTAGRQEIYFHGPSAEGFDAVAGTVLDVVEGLASVLGFHADPEWSHYLHLLCPSEEQPQAK